MSERPITAAQQDILNRLTQPPYRAQMIRVPPEILATCAWEEDQDGIWHASCGDTKDHCFYFESDGPERNGFKFCPFCGRKLAQVKQE